MHEELTIIATINRPIYEFNYKRYMDIRIADEIVPKIEKIHSKFRSGMWNPLKGNILRVKIPYRYNRVDCKVEGLTPVQEMEKDDSISATIQFCGGWEAGLYWKFTTIRQNDKNIY